MAVPATRAQFKEYCLRKLGKPVIEINVDDDQVEDRIDESIRYFWDYHFDGSHRTYYKHIVTGDDITNKYITMPENIIGAINIFDRRNIFVTIIIIRHSFVVINIFIKINNIANIVI